MLTTNKKIIRLKMLQIMLLPHIVLVMILLFKFTFTVVKYVFFLSSFMCFVLNVVIIKFDYDNDILIFNIFINIFNVISITCNMDVYILNITVFLHIVLIYIKNTVISNKVFLVLDFIVQTATIIWFIYINYNFFYRETDKCDKIVFNILMCNFLNLFIVSNLLK